MDWLHQQSLYREEQARRWSWIYAYALPPREPASSSVLIAGAALVALMLLGLAAEGCWQLSTVRNGAELSAPATAASAQPPARVTGRRAKR